MMKSKLLRFCLISFCLFFFSFVSSGQDILYELYVSSRGSNSVKKYDLDGNYLSDFVPSNYGGLATTEDIVFHPDGSVLVTGFSNSTIKRYDGNTGNYLGDFSTGYILASPSKMSIGWDNLIYVTQWGATQNNVVRFDLSGNFVDEFTSIGAPNGMGHVWDDDLNFFIALYGNNGDGTVHKFDFEGNDLGTFINSEMIQGPTSIWWDDNGDMLVEDWLQGTVIRYDTMGQFLEVFIDGMSAPEGIAYLPNGNFLIGDWGLDVIHLFDPDGISLGNFTSGNGLHDPNSIKLKEIVTTSVAQINIEQPEIFVSPGSGPGPFQISVTSHHATEASVEIWNSNGQFIETIVENTEITDQEFFYWKPSSKSTPGMYLIRLITRSQNQTMARKVILTN